MLDAPWYKLYSACVCVISLEGFNGHAVKQNYCYSIRIPLQLLPTWLLLFVRNNRRRTSTCVQSDPEVGGNDRGGLGIN